MILYFSRLIILACILTTAIMVSPACAGSTAGDLSFGTGLISPDLLRVSADSGIASHSADYAASGNGFPPEFRWAVPGEVGVHAFSIAIDDQDYVYATDPINHSVWKFLPDGSRISQFGSAGNNSGEFTAPFGVAVNSSGYVYVTDLNRVQVFDPYGDFVTAWGSAGNSTGEFNSVIGIAVNESGYLYTSETRTNRIQVFDPEGNFLTTWGSAGSGPGEFNGPMSVAANGSGFVFVADQFNNRVQVFDPSGGFVQSWNRTDGSYGSGNGEFSFPQTIAVSGNGYVYVGDAGNHRVQVFDQAGVYVKQFPASVGLGIAVNSTGYAYLTDYSYDRIQVFDPDGTSVSSWGARGDGEGTFFHPWGVAVNASGYSFVTDSENHRVQVFSPAGDFAGQWGSQGSGNGQFLLPLGIAVNGSGFVYVADSTNNRIQVFDPFGGYVTQWGSSGTGAGQLFDPRGIAVNSSGFVYVAETANARVQVFSSNGVSLGYWGSQGSGAGQFSGPMGIAVNSSGYVFVGENSNNRVQVFDPSGGYVMQMGSAGSGDGMLSSPIGVATDAGGQVFVADSGNHRIMVFDEYGGYAGQWGSSGTNPGQFSMPSGVAADSSGNVVVSEWFNDRIQKFAVSEPLPVPYIWASTVSGDAPLSVLFMGDSYGSPLSWNWTFGDGTFSDERNITHMYQTSGNYTVSLTVVYPNGVNTTSQADMITVTEPLLPVPVIWASTQSGDAPLMVNFVGDSVGGTPLNWSWSFGDGEFAGGQNASHTYQTPGIYTVNLTVVYPSGVNTTSQADMITVTEPPLPAPYIWASTQSGDAPLSVQFVGYSEGSPLNWSWSFGDGEFGGGRNASHTYQTPGIYTVNLTVVYPNGINTTSQADMINVTAPVEPVIANFTANRTSGKIPLAVRFTDVSSGLPTSWAWSFGDGANSSLRNPEHTYTAAGNYTVSLTVTGDSGSNTTVRPAYIRAASATKPVAAFTANRTSGKRPLAVKFTDQSTGSPTSWAWNFGDGATSALRNPSHTYTKLGVYTVSLTATNDQGSSTKTRSYYIWVTPW